MNQLSGAAAIDVASKPWALSQNQPLDTAAFIDEAKKRGFQLDISTLRELYRYRLLIPFVELTYRRVREPAKPIEPESPLGGTHLVDLKSARDVGRLRDLSTVPFRPRLSLALSRKSWTSPASGVLYSPYQLLTLPELKAVLAERTYRKHGKGTIARLPMPTNPVLLDRIERLRKMAIVLTAIEARYLPNLDPEWVQLSNVADVADWEAYRSSFDPVQTQEWLAYPPAQVRQGAEWLLHRAYQTDPVGADWSRIMRRAPAKSRQYLKDAALLALGDRIAAEILLRFYEDLARRGQAEPLPNLSHAMGWHPLHERLSNHPDTLDEDLIRLGISPHPRVVLALEGDTETYHAPRIWQALEYPDAPELMRLLKLGGTSRDLTKIAALTAAPLVSEKAPGVNAWNLIKPYTRLFLAVDPDEPFTTPAKVEAERSKILDEIRDVLHAQGVTRPKEQELNELIEIRTWQEPCYEFANFTDDELAEGIIRAHPTIEGWTKDQLIEALGDWRARKADIKRVWESGRWVGQSNQPSGRWESEVSKVKLAVALWPTLEQKIEQMKVDASAPVPPIVQVISDAYHLAQQWRYLSFVLTEEPDKTAEPSTGVNGS